MAQSSIQVAIGVKMKELNKGACLCVLLGIVLFLSMVHSEATLEYFTLERMRHIHRKRSMLRQQRMATDDVFYPAFDNGTARNISTSSGKTAYLPCRVRHLGDRTVSWIRQKDLHVLTVGKFTYTSDQRYKVIHLDNSEDWTLIVEYPQRGDAGLYECQVSTVPKLSIFVTLNVLVSKANILGGPSIYIKSGNTLNLTCIVMDAPVPPDYLFWYHNGKVINYESPRGISVHTEESARTASELLIRNTQPSDSGNYSCVPSNADPATIAVHVLNDRLLSSMPVTSDLLVYAGSSKDEIGTLPKEWPEIASNVTRQWTEKQKRKLVEFRNRSTQ